MQPGARSATENDIIFYDGTCGLCHGFVKWVLRHDAGGKFQLAPLQGETLRQLVSEQERAKLPDSIVVLTADGQLLMKSAAARYVAERLGFRATAALLRLLPRWLADFGYDVIAKTRYRIYGRKQEMCPLVPVELRRRFLP
jgi:predicted DCC family thiol-disulfide oxidoreductase YuxK